MTAIDIINRINDAIRNGDALDLENLKYTVCDLMIEDAERTAWLALIETAAQSIEGAYC